MGAVPEIRIGYGCCYNSHHCVVGPNPCCDYFGQRQYIVFAKTLKKGDKIQLVGFGTFEVAKRAAREGKNPQTGAKIKIPASKAPKFKAGKALKDAVNKK